jgi:hypothetical protein
MPAARSTRRPSRTRTRDRHASSPAFESLEDRIVLQGGAAAPIGDIPAQIRAAYGLEGLKVGGLAADEAGQTIAVISLFDDPGIVNSASPGFSSSDLARFDQQFGLPDPPALIKFNALGQTTGLPPPSSPGTR